MSVSNIHGRSVRHSRCAAKFPARAVEGAASAGVSRLPSATGSGHGLTPEDAAILSRLSFGMRADYRLADLFDAMHVVTALRVCGSVVDAVGIDELHRRLREQREGN